MKAIIFFSVSLTYADISEVDSVLKKVLERAVVHQQQR